MIQTLLHYTTKSNKKTLNIMPATATKTRAVSTKINNNTGKKLSYSQQKKAINEISVIVISFRPAKVRHLSFKTKRINIFYLPVSV